MVKRRVVVPHVLERVQVTRRRITGLGARDVEADDALVAEPDRQLGDLQRAGRVPHRGDQAAHRDGASVGADGLLAVGEPGQHRVDDVVERQPFVDVQFRREPDLGVDHVVGGQVLDALVGHPVQRLGRLHHPDRVRERLQVAHQRAAVRRGAEPRGQLVDVGGRQSSYPTCSASSSTVAGRRPPSRWSCSSALGACRIDLERSAAWSCTFVDPSDPIDDQR